MNQYNCSFQESLLHYRDNMMLRIIHQNKMFKSCNFEDSNFEKGEDKISLNYNRGILGVTIQLYFPNVEFENKAYLIAKHRISSGLSDCLCVCVWGLSMWTLDSLRKTFITF